MPSSDRTPHPLTILVVDDSVDTAESEADLLALQGHAVRVALNGEEALRCVDAQPPDVVLLDIRLPGMDGYAVARQILERCAGAGRRPLIVAVTGCGNDVDRQQSAEAGFDLHLVKPVDPALLIGMLERFRRLLAPSIPAADLDALTEDPPDAWFHAPLPGASRLIPGQVDSFASVAALCEAGATRVVSLRPHRGPLQKSLTDAGDS